MRDEAALRAKFEASDTDGNGTIGEAQFKGLVRKLGLPLSDKKASKAFAGLDTQGAGQVEFAAFSAWWFKYERP